MPATDTLINTLFDGRYRIVRKLGTGGMANVYLAEDQELGRRVAIKILNDRHSVDDQFVERFRREAKSAAALSHPNIVSIYDRGEAEGTYYIAMEHLDGRTLKELIKARGPAPPHIVVDYGRQMLSALRFAHRNGIVHRDMKPHNMLVDAEGRVKVTDFGIARAGATQMTEAGSIVGTAQYLSPEQARGSAVDQRSDLYSLGIVLYELLTGTVPFSGDTPVEIAMKHLSETPEPPSRRQPGVPHELDLVVMRALAKDPDDRYQSAEEMERDLDRIARGERVTTQTADAATSVMAAASAMPTTITRAPTALASVAEPYTPPTAAPPVMYDYDDRPRRRRPFWPWLLAVLLLAGAGVGGWFAYDRIQDELNATKPVAVPFVEGREKELAKQALADRGLRWRITYEFSEDIPVGHVVSQTPNAGDKTDKGNVVALAVSLGKERVEVPNVIGTTLGNALNDLADAGLRGNPVNVPSRKPEGTVTGQSPSPGSRVPKNASVRINVSSGPRPVAVPNVVGQPYEDASSALQNTGFGVRRRDVTSDQPAGIVVSQSPSGNSSAPDGSTITLEVSKGPSTVLVPNVEGVERANAVSALETAGFTVRVGFQNTAEPALDGVVTKQSPAGGTKQKPNSTVTITVGRFTPQIEPGGPQTDTPGNNGNGNGNGNNGGAQP
jgi:serine/threonine-protein kinase